MQWRTTSVYEAILKSYMDGKRRIFLQGGTASSKTISSLQFLILVCRYAKEPLLASVVSESFPHLKRGCLRDFQNLMAEDYNPDSFNKSDYIYNFGNGKLEFFSADQSDKLRGARRNILFINECNNVGFQAFRELDIRTQKFTIGDFNPVSEFWLQESGLLNQSENVLHRSTYRDALAVIPPEVVENIKKTGELDLNWKHIYDEGLFGKIEGLVFPSFEQIDNLPKAETFYGLDWGFTDPSALVECMLIGDSLYIKELIYQSGLTNADIIRKLEELGIRKNYDEIFADPSSPESVEELHRAGYNIKPAPSKPGAVNYGIQKVRQHRLFVTKDSLNLIKSLRNYRYIEDKDGKLTDKTTHEWSHLPDAVRYGLIGKVDSKEKQFMVA